MKSSLYIWKPRFSGGQWVVIVTQGKSPIAPIAEMYTAKSEGEAFQIYRRRMVEAGRAI